MGLDLSIRGLENGVRLLAPMALLSVLFFEFDFLDCPYPSPAIATQQINTKEVFTNMVTCIFT